MSSTAHCTAQLTCQAQITVLPRKKLQTFAQFSRIGWGGTNRFAHAPFSSCWVRTDTSGRWSIYVHSGGKRNAEKSRSSHDHIDIEFDIHERTIDQADCLRRAGREGIRDLLIPSAQRAFEDPVSSGKP